MGRRRHVSYSRLTTLLAAGVLAFATPVGAQVAHVTRKLVTGGGVKNGSLTGADFRNGSLPATEFPRGTFKAGTAGAPGPAGDRGAAGDTGPAGRPGAAGSDAATNHSLFP